MKSTIAMVFLSGILLACKTVPHSEADLAEVNAQSVKDALDGFIEEMKALGNVRVIDEGSTDRGITAILNEIGTIPHFKSNVASLLEQGSVVLVFGDHFGASRNVFPHSEVRFYIYWDASHHGDYQFRGKQFVNIFRRQIELLRVMDEYKILNMRFHEEVYTTLPSPNFNLISFNMDKLKLAIAKQPTVSRFMFARPEGLSQRERNHAGLVIDPFDINAIKEVIEVVYSPTEPR